MFIVHTSNASWPTRKKVGENRDKFYLLPTVGQYVVVIHTRQRELANKNLSCEGRLRIQISQTPNML